MVARRGAPHTVSACGAPLVAQALVEPMILLSNDEALRGYGTIVTVVYPLKLVIDNRTLVVVRKGV